MTCAIGIQYVGVTTIPMGLSRSISAYTAGKMTKYTGRLPVMTVSIICQLAILIFILFWTPSKEQIWLFFVITSLHGVALGLTAPNLNALIAMLFSHKINAAFAAFNMIDILGHTIGYGYSSIFCIDTKIYMALILVTFQNAGCL